MSARAERAARKSLKSASQPPQQPQTDSAMETDAKPAGKSKAGMGRQATPFAASKSKSAKSSRTAPLPALAELAEGDDEEEPVETDPTASLAAQFEAASGASGDDEEDEEADASMDEADQSAAEESAAEDEDEDEDEEGEDQSAKKKPSASQKKDKSASKPSVSIVDSSAKVAKALTLVPTTLKELQFHLKQLHRIAKKLRAFQTKKVVRKLKDTKALNAPADVLSALEADLDLTKHFNLDHLGVLAWRIYNLGQSGKKVNWEPIEEVTLESVNAPSGESAPTSSLQPRLKELLSQTLHSPAAKKAVTEYLSAYQKKQRKDVSREKKLTAIERAAKERKEKEKVKKEKQEERERKQKEEKETKEKASKQGAEDESDDEGESKEKEPVAKKAKTAKAGDAAEEATPAPAAAASSGDASAEDADRESKRTEKLSRREQQKQKKAALAAERAAEAEKIAQAKKDLPDAQASGSDTDDSDDKDKAGHSTALKVSKPSRMFSGLRVGQLVDGVISGVEKFGLFIEFVYKKKERKGLCHISMASDAFISDLASQFATGDAVQSIVTKLDEQTGRISLGLKASLFPEGKKPKPIQHLAKTARALEPKDAATKDASGGGVGVAGGAPKLESVFMDSLAEKKPGDARLATIKRYLSEVRGTNAQKADKKNRLGQRERRKLIGAVLGDEAIKPILEQKSAGGGAFAWKKKVAEEQKKHDGGPATPTPSKSAPVTGEDGAILNRREKRLQMHKEMAAKGEAPQAFVAALEAGVFDRKGAKPKREKPANATTASAAPAARPASAAAPSREAAKAQKSSEPRAAAKAPAAPAPAVIDETMHPSWIAKQQQAAKLALAPKGKKITFD